MKHVPWNVSRVKRVSCETCPVKRVSCETCEMCHIKRVLCETCIMKCVLWNLVYETCLVKGVSWNVFCETRFVNVIGKPTDALRPNYWLYNFDTPATMGNCGHALCHVHTIMTLPIMHHPQPSHPIFNKQSMRTFLCTLYNVSTFTCYRRPFCKSWTCGKLKLKIGERKK